MQTDWIRPEEMLPPLDKEVVVLGFDSSGEATIAFVGKFTGQRGADGRAVFNDRLNRPWGDAVAAWSFKPSTVPDGRNR